MIDFSGQETQEKLFLKELGALGTPVSRREAPGLLFRYPGACGARDHFNESLTTLASPALKFCHFTTELIPYSREGARRFGLLVVPNPDGKIPLVRLPGEEPAYLSVNAPMKQNLDYCWVPASLLAELRSEGTPASVPDILRRHGNRILEARLSARIELEDYFREVRQVISSGLPLPEERWHEISEAKRRAILREIGAEPVWTPAASARLGLQ